MNINLDRTIVRSKLDKFYPGDSVAGKDFGADAIMCLYKVGAEKYQDFVDTELISIVYTSDNSDALGKFKLFEGDSVIVTNLVKQFSRNPGVSDNTFKDMLNRVEKAVSTCLADSVANNYSTARKVVQTIDSGVRMIAPLEATTVYPDTSSKPREPEVDSEYLVLSFLRTRLDKGGIPTAIHHSSSSHTGPRDSETILKDQINKRGDSLRNAASDYKKNSESSMTTKDSISASDLIKSIKVE